MTNDKADEVAKKLFQSLFFRYQNGLEMSNDKIKLGRFSVAWIKTKKTKLNLINKKDHECFQYALTVILNHEQIKKDPRRITKTCYLTFYR